MEKLPNKEIVSIESVCFAFFKDGKFLVEHRPSSNPALGGETVIPAEKMISGETPPQTLRRGVMEEMGDVVPTDWQYVGLVHNRDQINKQDVIVPLHIFLVTGWEGHIQNLEPHKGVHQWVDRDDIVSTLTYKNSIMLVLLALADAGIIKTQDFHQAPQLEFPENLRGQK